MNFDDINDGQFEELTYDLLIALGLRNVSWRRGTGKGGASADQGRDIVADEVRTGVDGSTHMERWFVQCKHYKAGVPPQKLEDALAWANAERPQVLLIVVSNFLSNPAKQFIEKYTSSNCPPFRIRTWERKDLERLLSSHPGIVRKFGLEPGNPFIDAHPAHMTYLMAPPHNTLNYLFEQIEKLPKSDRDHVFGWTYISIINPRYREPTHKNETMGELLLDAVDYASFKKMCYELSSTVSESFLVRSIVIDALTWLWHQSNPRLLPDMIERSRGALSYFSQRMEETEDPEEIETLRRCIATAEGVLGNAEQRQLSNHKLYSNFCETLIQALSLEERVIDMEDDT